MTPAAAASMMKIVAIAFISFGIASALAASQTPLAIPGVFVLDVLDWPVDGDPSVLDRTSRLLSAIGGGVLTALGVMLHQIVAPALSRGDQAIRRAALVAIVSWFVVDSSGSIASGVASNAVFNLLILALTLAPLVLVRRA